MGNPDKSYDEIQREAELVQCSQCQQSFYMTHPHPRQICAICRDEIARERRRYQEQASR